MEDWLGEFTLMTSMLVLRLFVQVTHGHTDDI